MSVTVSTHEKGAPQRRHRRHANPLAMRLAVTPIDPDALFGRRAPLALDVGCGPGLFVVQLAEAKPDHNVLGLEIRAHLVQATREAIAAQNEARAAENKAPLYAEATVANANLHLAELLPDACIGFVSVNFPDPWYKKRHHKRRVLNEQFLAVLRPKLLAGAELHVMTDYLPIAEAMGATLRAASDFVCMHPDAPYAPHSTTHLTSEREQTHLRRGEPIYRMAYVWRPVAGLHARQSHGSV